MKRLLAALAAAAAMGALAYAAGYDDFTHGLTANLRGDYAAAVTAFTTALAAPDLVAAYKPAAYRGRAVAYLNSDACDKAKQDLDAYDKLRPGEREVNRLRIWLHLCLKDSAGARNAFNSLATGELTAVDLWDLAQLQWHYGLYDEATVTGREAFTALRGDDDVSGYVLVWLAVTAQRAGKLDQDEIAADVAKLKLSDWPKPVIDLYLGKMTPENLQKEAESWRSDKEDAQRCEANFYTAEWHLGRSDQPKATPLLLEVVHSCPIDFIELGAAKVELKRLGVPVPKE